MLTKRMEEALNKQINEEIYSAHLYLSMSAYCSSQNFNGFANWMQIQYQEEMSHAQKLFNYVHDRGGKVILDAIAKPQNEWNDLIDVFEATLKHEMHISDCINVLADTALEEKDHATSNFLQWYISEQVEEEANVSTILTQLQMNQNQIQGLFLLDKELSTRVFVDATKE
jgi:ferritin